jgi:hypothetical protein
MPQLDKYIFFNHVISLTIFFALIYIFIRKSVVPEISSLLKFRKKKTAEFTTQLADYEKLLNFSKSTFEKKGKNYLNKLSDEVEKLIVFYNKKASGQLLNVYNQNFQILKNSNHISNLIIKNKKELKRINNII